LVLRAANLEPIFQLLLFFSTNQGQFHAPRETLSEFQENAHAIPNAFAIYLSFRD
jgi:hypothetical protein